MKDETLVADLIRAGVSADLVGRVVAEITATMSGTSVRDNIREYERVRKKRQRFQRPKANDVGTDCPGHVPDSPLLTSSLSSTESQRSKEEVVARRRGCRIPDDFWPDAKSQAVFSKVCPGRVLDEVMAEFRDFWIAVPGARGCKTDWQATFRNNSRRIGRANGHMAQGNGQPRPYSREWRQERTARALDDLANFARGGGDHDPPALELFPEPKD